MRYKTETLLLRQPILFLDRDGTLILEPEDYMVDSLEKLMFYPGIFRWLGRICREFDYKLVMITNQDGLGTDIFPESTFWPAHNKMMTTFEGEGIKFEEVLIDRSFPEENKATRKPGTDLLNHYINGNYDLKNSYVIGDRLTDIQLAKNLGCQGIWLANDPDLGVEELRQDELDSLNTTMALRTTDWEAVYGYLAECNNKTGQQ